jgi:hypothetical protein
MVYEVRLNLMSPAPDGQMVVVMGPDNPSDLSFVEKRNRPFGRCYMMHPEFWIRKLGISSIEVT